MGLTRSKFYANLTSDKRLVYMAIFQKIIKPAKEVKAGVKQQSRKMTSMEYFKAVEGKAMDCDCEGYMRWYRSLSSTEKQRINKIINAAPYNNAGLNRLLDGCVVDAQKVQSENIKNLPIKNLVPLRFVEQDSQIGEMYFRATGFVVCTEESSKAQEFPSKLDVVVIRSNGDVFKCKGVKVFKQGANRYYLNFNGYTSFELDKNLLKKYCKGVYDNGQRVHDLPKSEFVTLEDVVSRDSDTNIHMMHDYELAYYKFGNRRGIKL